MGRRAIALGLLLVAAVAIAGVFLVRSARQSSTNVENLAAVEIREYQGTDLSSIAAFHENSIKGPQQIDLESYRLKVDGLVENSLEYTLAEVTDNHQSYKKVVTLNSVEGWCVTILWEGVLVKS